MVKRKHRKSGPGSRSSSKLSITVKGTVRDQPDAHLYAEALILLAKEQLESEVHAIKPSAGIINSANMEDNAAIRMEPRMSTCIKCNSANTISELPGGGGSITPAQLYCEPYLKEVAESGQFDPIQFPVLGNPRQDERKSDE